MSTVREKVLFGAQLADLKELVYKNSLALAALSEILIARGLLTEKEIAVTMQTLDQEFLADLTVGDSPRRVPSRGRTNHKGCVSP